MSERGFTIIELFLVIIIIGLLSVLGVMRMGSMAGWKEENFIRRLTQTITFLHSQSVVDQAFYRLEFDLDKHTYTVGVMKAEGNDKELELLASDIGNLSLELAAFLNPSLGEYQTFIPPPSMPSLAEPQSIPDTLTIQDIRTMRGKQSDGKPYIMFSPRGFSEFSVLHFIKSDGNPMTVLVNPFTGNTEIFRDYKDFMWSYGRKKEQQDSQG